MTGAPPKSPASGLRIRVRGQVQGVGFRPFIWQLAQSHGVTGQVLNDPEGVLIEAFGATDAFVSAITSNAPPLARVDAVEPTPFHIDTAPAAFLIAASEGVGAETRVTPDAATCPDCLAEIRDPSERRAGYAFANCTHCGPRFSILDRLPYDRAQTSMADFPMCDACRSEYEDPGDRRFHAQPVACPDCGPQIWLETPDGTPEPPFAADVLGDAADRLLAGEILAIKGIGGFHLACDATQAEAIATLRTRKHRPSKPLALMASEPVLAQYASPGPDDWPRLRDPAAPIVLLPRLSDHLPNTLAPGQDQFGWMLPYTPLHHLLLDRVARPLVMTSGNLSGEPQVIGNDEARTKLFGFADALLLHNRDIRRRLDDSVERMAANGPMVLRRGRGRVPGTVPMPPGFENAPPILAVGGQMKGAICLTKPGQALLSHHLGDLDGRLNYAEFQKAVADYTDLFDHRPTRLACDLHPGYRASAFAKTRAADLGLPLIDVQHHHAHLASCMAEALWPCDGGKVAGIILDGLGLGPDGTIWGGEVLLGDYAGFDRTAWLKPAALPGGDSANRDPWRNAVARLDQAGRRQDADRLFGHHPLSVLRHAVAEGVNAPLSSSAGRLFDAFAAVLGTAPDRQSFEGEAAMTLEALARSARTGPDRPPELPVHGGQIDPAPLFDLALDQTRSVARRAALFHTALAHGFAAVARDLVETGQANAVVLSGGCFQNAVLLQETLRALEGVPTLTHKSVPANDGGLALGQALIAAAQP